jgi:hypothetical protein
LSGALLSALGMAGVVWGVGTLLPADWPSWAALITLFAVGVVAYAILIRILAPSNWSYSWAENYCLAGLDPAWELRMSA